MCGASHIQLAAAGARSFCQFRSTRVEREARANAFKAGAYGANDRAADELSIRLVAAPGQMLMV
jgi:hypothetical protein